ncbi:transcriptional regulator [Rodentibacter trehalosifermentans]|uniref:Transcriptional regulator n=2 Tax=Rodentibacter TaxID=1960084 RepID=A0A1V3IJI8_9PAST|nr:MULTISPECIES: BolA family protein [Rodentibacter]OOF41438.1 transcriptional regulator [Rodentibacter rarus]OOF42737.1 transcriptional regulator [Rodentibacter rarus]OOF49313.1 transcriptional regulator [Rodentibacter trehalosifermentans]
MSKQQALLAKIHTEFRPHFVAVENESHLHSSGRGADSHFKFVIVSDIFEGMSRVQRHQTVYQLFADDLKNGIHALALHLYTKEEWMARGEVFPSSPNCSGVGL